MSHERVLIVPLAGDLARDETGSIVVGRRTRKSCLHAIAVARSYKVKKPLLLLTASHADEKWDGVRVADVMQRFIQHEAPDIDTAILEAKLFNTLGELLAVAKYAKHAGPFEQIDIVCEQWRARRVDLVARVVFGQLAVEAPWMIERVYSTTLVWLWKVYELAARVRVRQQLRRLYPHIDPKLLNLPYNDRPRL